MNDPLDHPKITVPGRGTYVVKFGLGAQYTLEKEYKVTMEQVGQRLQEAAPREVNGVTVPGRISPAFLFDVLSACIWGQIQISPRDLAECYDSFDQIAEVAKAVMVAFTKTRWSANSAPTPATATGQEAPIQ